MLSSQVVSGPKDGVESTPITGGGTAQWVLANDGEVPWPDMTTLRLVGGPVLMEPIVQVPPAALGQTVVIDLEVQETAHDAEVFYMLVTPEGAPFGEVLNLKVTPKPRLQPPVPVCVVLTTPVDGLESGLEALQGEMKVAEWLLANVGTTPWPEDATATLFYNTPGFDRLPSTVEIPSIQPGMTAHVGIGVLAPDMEGQFKAMWAVTSPTCPEFGDVLFVELSVSDFPFMEWMVAEAPQAETLSSTVSTCETVEELESVENSKLSMGVVLQNHLLPTSACVSYDSVEETEGLVSLGVVSGVSRGSPWMLELTLVNDGTVAWPSNTELSCCYGSGLGCSTIPLPGGVGPGEVAQLCIELSAPDCSCQNAWVLKTGEGCFGPLLFLQVQA